jgi:hypothetical protein
MDSRAGFLLGSVLRGLQLRLPDSPAYAEPEEEHMTPQSVKESLGAQAGGSSCTLR